MTDKILEAVKALGGNIENINSSDGDKSNYVALCVKGSSDGFVNAFRGEYWDVMGDFNSESFKKICTAEEFNTAAAEWIKEAYMHNAAIDLRWDINNSFNYKGEEYLFRNSDTGVYVDSDDEDDCDGYYTLICNSQEFIDYCDANKPQSQVETPEEKEALDMIEKKSGVSHLESRPLFKSDGRDKMYTGYKFFVSDKPYTCVGFKLNGAVIGECDETGNIHCFLESMCDGGKSPRDKAIETISKAPKYRMPESKAAEVYDWLKSLTPEQKKEFGL